MQFNSYEFILILLPLTLLIYFTVGRINLHARKLVICAVGLGGYYFAGVKALVVLIGSMIANYFMCEMMLETKKLKKIFMLATVLMNICIIFLFRYADFAITTVNDLLGKEISLLSLTLPVGVCFFTLQQLAYVISVYKGKTELNFPDYLAYVLYFPKLIMGPLIEPEQLIGEINDMKLSRWNWDNCVSGIKMFCFGLFKKVVIADTFLLATTWGADNMYSASSLDLIIVMLSYTFRIYFDFSGYCDMAIGFSKMLNINLPQNFNSPYKAVTLRDFTRRWHISLTDFLTNYLYIPLGGSRKGIIRTYLNIFIVFAVCGFWHGENLTRIVWGLAFGFLFMAERIADPILKKVPKVIRWVMTFGVVNIMWLLFSAPSISAWIYEIKTIVLGGKFTLSSGLSACFRGVEMPFFEDLLHLNGQAFSSGMAWMIMYLLVSMVLCLAFKNNDQIKKKNGYIYMVLSALAFAWSFLFLGAETAFIFNF